MTACNFTNFHSKSNDNTSVNRHGNDVDVTFCMKQFWLSINQFSVRFLIIIFSYIKQIILGCNYDKFT